MDVKGPTFVDAPQPATVVSPIRSGRAAPSANANAQTLASAVAETQDVAASARAGRIQELTSQVSEGTYQPNAAQIADQIYDEARLDAQIRAAFSAG